MSGRGRRRSSAGPSSRKPSTSTTKCPFKVQEKVLCYEPDPTKYRVLYEAKILKIGNYTTEGRMAYEYLIHFLGWNSSWDRYVTEDFVLKICEESRELQKKLNEDAEELKNAATKPTRRKGSSRTSKSPKQIKIEPKSPPIQPEPEITVCDGLVIVKQEKPENDSSEDEERTMPVPIPIPDLMKSQLIADRQYIREKRYATLPAKPNVVQILEDSVKYYGLEQLSILNRKRAEKDKGRSRTSAAQSKANQLTPNASPLTGKATSSPLVKTTGKTPAALAEEKIREELTPLFQDVEVMKEVVDSVRIMFDFVLHQVLFYQGERDQFVRCYEQKLHTPYDTVFRKDFPDSFVMFDSELEADSEVFKKVAKPNRSKSDRPMSSTSRSRSSAPRSCSTRSLEIGDLPSTSAQSLGKETRNGGLQSDMETIVLPTYKKTTDDFVTKLLAWRMMPASAYESDKKLPSLMYGLPHLFRLFVKAPDILGKATIAKRRLGRVVFYMNKLIGLIDMRSEYGEHLYEAQPYIEMSSIKVEVEEPALKRKLGRGRPRKYPPNESK